MIFNLEPYPAYKDSGIPWLGEVPEHWEMERAKWLFRKMDRPVRHTDEVVTCFRDGTVTLRRNRRVRGFTESLKEIGYQGIRRGDLVIHAMDAFAGAIGVADSEGKGTPVYSVCEAAPTANAHYYAYTMREMARSQWIQALAKGIRERSTDFRFDGFSSQPVPLPPLPEQATIVRFLGHADRRIRRYISAKQKLIKLLEEQQQAIIHRAVTRGLDRNVRVKPSGVEWLGNVPASWSDPVRLKYVSSLKGRLGWQGLQANEYTGEGPYVVSSAHITNRRIDWTRCPHVSLERYEMDQNIQLAEQDVLLMKDGAAMGKLAFIDELPAKACLNSHLVLFRPRCSNSRFSYEPKYLFYLMTTRVFQDYVQINGRGATFAGISEWKLGNYTLCLPPLLEQERIVEFLDAKVATLKNAQATAQAQIGQLNEHRTRLIADVVTGKLDVREVAANLPEVIESHEPSAESEFAEVVEESIEEAFGNEELEEVEA